MNFYLKTGLIIFALIYLVSPVDIIPDVLLPFIGWIDDGVVIGSIYYLIRYGKLPGFLFKKNPFKPSSSQSHDNFSSHKTNPTNGQADQNRSSSKVFQTPYEILGISPSASKTQIQTAYKDAIKKYHPDKLAHLGEEFCILANKKFIEIQNAYDTLMKK